jgi:DNA-3-methyladenine glycosylase
MNSRILQPEFYKRNTKIVAQQLLGNILVHKTPRGILSGVIVEVEAYFGDGDPASHAARGRTKRSSIMFGEPGVAYVYINYGIHHLLNVVTECEGTAGAVLIRALEPLKGKSIMVENRKVHSETELTSGPGKLTQALGIDLSCNGQSLGSSHLHIVEGKKEKIPIKASRRIGISVAQDALLRYYVEGNPFVSGQ